MIDPYRIILGPVVTEKSTGLAQAKRKGSGTPLNQYSFNVAPDATKPQIKEALEAWWVAHRGVPIRVVRVNTLNQQGKLRRSRGRQIYGRTRARKKAVVTLRQGDSMDIY